MSARLSISIHEPPWPELESGIREGNYRSLSLTLSLFARVAIFAALQLVRCARASVSLLSQVARLV